MNLLLVALGGAIGSVGRYWVSTLTMRHVNSGFPWGTVAVNLLGCALIGALAVALSRLSMFSDELRLLLITGTLGGFTTFSAFGLDTWLLLQKGLWWYAAAYVGISVILGILLVGLLFSVIAHL